MDDVSLKHKAAAADDRDLDNLIFNDSKDAAATSTTAAGQRTSLTDAPQGEDEGDEGGKTARGSSISNVLPVDKLKNGASTATKVLGQTFSLFKEKSSAALETAKHSSAGSALADGLSRAAHASSEQMGKLKESDAYKKSSSFASSSYERTSVVASEALEKARASASVGLEKAKHGGSAAIETIKSKVGSDPKKPEQ
jgi:hypothetical protein